MNSRKLTALGLALSMCFLQIPVVCAGQTTILTDAELDAVHAGGLNFTFEKFFGSLSDATNQTSQNVDITLNSNPFIVTSNGNVTVKQTTAPTVPTTPATPTTPINPTSPTPSALSNPLPQNPQSSTPASSLTDSVNVATPVVTDILSSVPSASLNSDSAVSTLDPIPSNNQLSVSVSPDPLSNPSVSSSETVLLNDSSIGSSSVSLPADQVDNNTITDLASLSQNDLSNIVAGESAAISSTTTALNVPPIASATPVAAADPSASSSPSFVVDVVAGNSGVLGMNIGLKPNDASDAIPLASGDHNSVNISDTAQQNLDSFVNVNAAGSIVPVQVNLVVLMNSTVENLNVSNSLQLSNYTTIQLK